jgi:hypothetical protein
MKRVRIRMFPIDKKTNWAGRFCFRRSWCCPSPEPVRWGAKAIAVHHLHRRDRRHRSVFVHHSDVKLWRHAYLVITYKLRLMLIYVTSHIPTCDVTHPYKWCHTSLQGMSHVPTSEVTYPIPVTVLFCQILFDWMWRLPKFNVNLLFTKLSQLSRLLLCWVSFWWILWRQVVGACLENFS